jgi:hypothetical protein
MMADEMEFVGLRSLDDVKFALERLDEHCFYPARSGISFTRGLAPEAWEADWRLVNEAEALWTAYVSRREEMKLDVVEEINASADHHGYLHLPALGSLFVKNLDAHPAHETPLSNAGTAGISVQ